MGCQPAEYSWRGDARFQPRVFQTPAFTSIEVTNALALEEISPSRSDARIEITLENGRKLSISDGVDAGFVLELARGLAAGVTDMRRGFNGLAHRPSRFWRVIHTRGICFCFVGGAAIRSRGSGGLVQGAVE